MFVSALQNRKEDSGLQPATDVGQRYLINTFFKWPQTWNGTLLASNVLNVTSSWMKTALVLFVKRKLTVNETT